MPKLDGKDLGLLPTQGVGSYASPPWLIAMKRVQRAGSKIMAADELLKGFALPAGTMFA